MRWTMMPRSAIRLRLRNLRYGFLFGPGLVALGFIGLAAGILAVERASGANGIQVGFDGDASAARSVLSTIATSLITVAGVAFSITVVTLQLVSQQFTPRALRNFLADRVNQLMAGVFVGVFAYCLVMLSAVRDAEDVGVEGFVPALGVSFAIVLALIALGVLLVFIHHMSQSIQVSQIAADVAESTLNSLDAIYPEPFGEPADRDAGELLENWHAHDDPKEVMPWRNGYVQSIALGRIPDAFDPGGPLRVHLRLAPGRFARVDEPIALIWGGGDRDFSGPMRALAVIGSERDVRQDTLYGVRQLADIAMRAISPSINDPTTADTCIRYMRAILVRLAGRSFPARVRRYADHDVEVVAERDDFDDFVEVALVEVGRYASRDGRIATALLTTAIAVARAAVECDALERLLPLREAARTIAEPARENLPSERDRLALERLMAEIDELTGRQAATR